MASAYSACLRSVAILGVAVFILCPAYVELNAQEQAKSDKVPEGKKAPEPEAVVELLEDNIDFFLDNLSNNGVTDASIAAPGDRGAYSGKLFLTITPFQRFNMRMPNWRYKIAEEPKPGEFRYVRFAWKRTTAPAIMLQFHTQSGSWHRYYAGTLSESVQNWGAMTRIAEEPPRAWAVVTRDLFKDFGPMTIWGVGFSALDGGGEAHFDHIYLGRTIEDLDRVTNGMAKPPPPDPVVPAPEPVEPPAAPSRSWLLPAAAVVGALVLLIAVLLLVKVIRRPTQTTDDADASPIVCTCKGCGKKLKVKSGLAGKTVKCPQCNKSVSVPSLDSEN